MFVANLEEIGRIPFPPPVQTIDRQFEKHYWSSGDPKTDISNKISLIFFYDHPTFSILQYIMLKSKIQVFLVNFLDI